MTKTELVQKVAEKTKVTKSIVSDVIESVIALIVEADKTTIKGFGTFQWKTRPARKGVNPATGEKIDIPESTSLRYKPSAGMRGL
jgi:DNA-binding protein HU-beta